MRHALALLGALAGCAGPAPTNGPDTGGEPGATRTCDGAPQHWVIDQLAFARIRDGVSEGFDLDGVTTAPGDPTGCGIEDVTSPRGDAGVDNAFGRLIPALENTEFVGVEPLINATIRNGGLLLVVELSGLDDRHDDACVGMAMRRSTTVPLLGTDGSFLHGQTLDLDPDFADIEMPEQALVAGAAEGRPFNVDLPVQVLDAALEFELDDGAMRAELQEDGRLVGTFAGALDTAALIHFAATENVADEVLSLLEGAMSLAADLEPDAQGTCAALSMTFEFTATPVYIFEDALP